MSGALDIDSRAGAWAEELRFKSMSAVEAAHGGLEDKSCQDDRLLRRSATKMSIFCCRRHIAPFPGALLGLDIILATTRLTKVAILIDSQAAIKALRTRAAGPGSTLVREFYRKIGMLKRKRRTLQVKVVWVPGHLGVTGNENADREAKKAAMGENTGIFDKDRKSLLKKKLQSSKAAVVERMTKRIKKQHIDEWQSSSKCRFLKKIDPSPFPNRLQRIYDDLSRPEASIFTQLRTAHIGLNAHLHRIQASDSNLCQHCLVPETVSHYLLSYRRYTKERQTLRRSTGIHFLQIRHLLSDKSKHTRHLMTFVKSSNRFPVVFNGGHPSEEASQGTPQD